MNKETLFWQSYMNLEQSFLDLSKYIYITDVKTTKQKDGTVGEQAYRSQLETFSSYIADLLVQCCVQIEAISKELYHDLGGTKPRGSNDLFFDEDALKEIDKKWSTHTRVVYVVCPSFHLTKKENSAIKPLKEAHKRQGTYWEKAYQAVKHDRYMSLEYGNVRALLHAMAALYLLNAYYRNESWTVSYTDVSKIDMRLGSKIFAVGSPALGQLWYGNEPERSNSPYIVRYTDEGYSRLCAMQREEDDAFRNYIFKQPEINEPEFLARQDKAKHTKGLYVLWELCKYRMDKNVPANLPFEERKARLLDSAEYQRFIQGHEGSSVEMEISEDNIQQQIDEISTWIGIRLYEPFIHHKWVGMAMNQAICEVRLDENY